MTREHAFRCSDVLAAVGVAHMVVCAAALSATVGVPGAADYEVLFAPGQPLDITDVSGALAAGGYGLRHGEAGVPPPGYRIVAPQPQIEEADVPEYTNPQPRGPGEVLGVCPKCNVPVGLTGGRHAVGCRHDHGTMRNQRASASGFQRAPASPDDGDFVPPRGGRCLSCGRSVGDLHDPACSVMRSGLGDRVTADHVR